MILGADPGIEVVGQGADGSEAVPLVHKHRPDVLLMDVRMPTLDGIAATKAVTALPNPPKIIMLTTFDMDEYVFQALEAGASGFLLKDTPPQELARAVHVVAGGEAMLSPTVTRRMLSHFSEANPGTRQERHPGLEQLTERETEVLGAVGAGLSNAQIGMRLFMSEATVKAHVSKIFAKLDCTNRVQIAIIAHEAGLTDLDADPV
jgi:DNA-binding NarL/FixJ family response regulator